MLLLLACVESKVPSPTGSVAMDSATDSGVPESTPEVEYARTDCSLTSGFGELNRRFTYVVSGFPEGDWRATLEVTALGEGGRVTVVATEGTDGSNGVRSVITQTAQYRCDAEGVWLLEYSSELDYNGTIYGPDVLVLDAPYRVMPVDWVAGAVWEDRMVGTLFSGDGSQVVYEGTRDTMMVLAPRAVDTELGVMEAFDLEIVRDFGGSDRDRLQTNRHYYREDVGLVAVGSGGTEAGRVLLAF